MGNKISPEHAAKIDERIRKDNLNPTVNLAEIVKKAVTPKKKKKK